MARGAIKRCIRKSGAEARSRGYNVARERRLYRFDPARACKRRRYPARVRDEWRAAHTGARRAGATAGAGHLRDEKREMDHKNRGVGLRLQGILATARMG